MTVLDRLLLTASCVTSFPLRRQAQADSANLAGLSKYLPAVGLMIGTGIATAAWICRFLSCGQLVSSAVLTLLWLACSGGIHLDGLMDTADGLFSHRSRERMLEIMQDSRVGNFGVMAGVAVLLIKFACISTFSFRGIFAMALIVPAWARWTEALTIATFPYARAEGMGKVWHDTTDFPRDIVMAALLPIAATALVACYFGLQTAIALSLTTVVGGYLAALRISSILGGHTGDTYGATVEIAEAAAVLFAAVFLHQLRV